MQIDLTIDAGGCPFRLREAAESGKSILTIPAIVAGTLP